MENSNIKKDFDFVMRVLKNKDNKLIHLPALQKLIKNFEKKWCDLLGPGIADSYTNRLNKKYNVLQYN
jgi:hypothetical protein|tara:strand:+ start:2188 stop:2391 length:204 start_codon:yes stop_codon:yes gene_type:complete